MKKLLFFLILALGAIACEKSFSLSSNLESFNETELPQCKNADCPKISLDYPVYSGEETIASALNADIKSYLIACLHLSEDQPQPNTLEEVAAEFVQASNDLKSEFEMDLNYEATATIKEIYRNENIVSLEKRSYLFTGGAHGYGSVLFTHFDLKTGETIVNNELFVDFKGFQVLAEKHFRAAQGLSESGSINAHGYWFENDRFSLPESIGLSRDGVLLMYNQYDIASYADGPIEVILKWNDVHPYLSKLYFP